MEQPEFSHHGDDGYLTEHRESHWLPALRPDVEEDVQQSLSLEETVHSGTEHVVNPQQAVEHRPDIKKDPGKTNVQGSSASGNDDDDGRLDPAWGFKRTDSAHILDSAHRSSSFPKPFNSSEQNEPDSAVASQFLVSTEEPDFNDLLKGTTSPVEPVLNLLAEDDQNSPFDGNDHEQDLQMGQNTDSYPDNRFEEGVPLITNLEQNGEEGLTQRRSLGQANTFGDYSAEDEEEASFFTQIQDQNTLSHAQPTLERKSTDDVLDSIQSTKDRMAPDSPVQHDVRAESPSHGDDSLNTIEPVNGWKDEVPSTDLHSKFAALLDDDEFLVDDPDDLLPDSSSESGSPSSFIASLKDDSTIPATDLNDSLHVADLQQQQQPNVAQASSRFAPHQPSTSDMMQFSAKTHGNVGLTAPGLGQMRSFQNYLQQPSPAQKAESFADQAKGGYQSPYDLPMDLSKPKKRPHVPRTASQSQGMLPPPPRSSSMSSQKQLQSPFSPTNTTFDRNVAVGPSPAGSRTTSAAVSSPPVTVKAPSSSSFFEELPITSKPRPPSITGRYTPSHGAISSPPQLPPASPPRQIQPQEQISTAPPRISDPYAQFQLRPPEKLDPYANSAPQPATLVAPAAPTNRYSPAPGAVPGMPKPTPSPRYSPAPPPQSSAAPGRYASQPIPAVSGQAPANRYVSQPIQAPPSSAAALPFQPRTSSPLAYHGRPASDEAGSLMPPPPPPKQSSPQVGQPAQSLPPPRHDTPPSLPTPPQANNLTFSPPKQGDSTGPIGFLPPRRSQTQSPSKFNSRSAVPAALENTNNRPASAYSQAPFINGLSQPEQGYSPRSAGRPKATAPDLDFEQPQDETSSDELHRWRGAPIFKFGFGGVVVSSFPKRTPRYKAGQIKPQIKSTAGEVKTRHVKDLSLLPDHVTTFPGPLKNKSKKKDLLTWMGSMIAKLENEAPVILGVSQTLPDPRKCHEELILLWKIVRIFVENDGVVENKTEALKALNVILSPEVHAIDESTASQYHADTELTGIYRPTGASVRSDSVDPLAIENLRKHLLKGEREQAVWKAADARLWSHALLLASTFKDERKLWKQVVQEFVRQEVKTIGNNSESLSALYEIFGGNMEESIDQLVPPSARAGLQMVSKADAAGPTKNALEGLDRWKETLSLVLNNRTPDDQRALATLGALLGNYGRIQAAHICFLFARNPLSPNVFGGTDDQQASITLLGTDHRAKPLTFHQDQDAVLLTEAYEYAISTLAPAPMSISLPHLSAYKLRRALDLAENGFKVEAQAYCDAIGSGITSKTKMSPYYHASLLMEVDELAKRLKQVPVQSSSWIAKPSVERATSTLLSRLSNFVAGDDSDAESKGSAADIGPFAKSSGSPNLSRSASQTDLYGSYSTTAPTMPITAASSRYAPGGIASNRSSSDLTRGRMSLDSQRSPPATSHGHEPRSSMYNPASTFNQVNQSPARSINSYKPYGTSPSRSNYQATPPQPSYMPDLSVNQQTTLSPDPGSVSHAPSIPVEEQPSYVPSQPEQDISQDVQQQQQLTYGGYSPFSQPTQQPVEQQLDEAPASTYEPSQSYGYEPPADTGYVPYQPEPDSDDEKTKKQKPKKKSFMDDDQDEYSRMPSKPMNVSRPAQSDTSATKKAADDQADAAFKAAAEADAQRAKEQAAQKKAGGWLGGWFGGKKAETSLDSPKSSGGAEPKIYKAKLGEDKMKLYYDKDLKKWVNPDNPDSMKAQAATPPPPPGRSPAPPVAGGPPRMGGTPAPPMINSRASTPASTTGEAPGLGIGANRPPSVNASPGRPGSSGNSAPPISSGLAAPPLGGLAPPSRPASNASSIDDLIGPAGPRKGAKSARAAKKGRYVDVMGQ